MNTKRYWITQVAALAILSGMASAVMAGDAIERLRTDGDLSRAKVDLLRAAVADPRSQVTLFNLAVIFERERDWSAAIDLYERAIQAGPATAMGQTARDRLAAAKRIAGLSTTEEGRDQLRYEVALARAAEARTRLRGDDAVAILRSAFRMAPERWEAPAMIGAILAETGRFDDAAVYFREARRTAPAEDRARFDRAIEAVLTPSWHLFDSALAHGSRRAAGIEKLAREVMEPRGGERIKEAAALLVARDIDAAVGVLREAVEGSAVEAPVAGRMLRELAPVSGEARLAVAALPVFSDADGGRSVDAFLRDPLTEEIRLVASAPPRLNEQKQASAAAYAPAEPVAPMPPAPAAPVVPTVTRQPAPEPLAPALPAIVLQVGAYRKGASAEAIARALQARGYEAQAMHEGSMYRVTVGPFRSGEDAVHERDRLARDGYQAIVRTRSGG